MSGAGYRASPFVCIGVLARCRHVAFYIQTFLNTITGTVGVAIIDLG